MKGARLAVLGVAMAAVMVLVALRTPDNDPVAMEGPPLSLNSGRAVSGLKMVPMQSLAKKPKYWVTHRGDLVYVQKRGAPLVSIVNIKTNDVKHIRVDGKVCPTALNRLRTSQTLGGELWLKAANGCPQTPGAGILRAAFFLSFAGAL